MLARGQRLFTQGQSSNYTYLVLSGWLALERVLCDGQRQIVDFALPGSLIGHARDADGLAPHSAECLTDCWLVVFERRRFEDLLHNSKGVCEIYNASMLDDLERAHDALSNIARRSGAAKIAHLIIQLMDRARATCIEEDPLRLPLSQNHLAGALGITNVYVSRVVKTMRADGLIAWRRGCLHVLNAAGLRTLVEE